MNQDLRLFFNFFSSKLHVYRMFYKYTQNALKKLLENAYDSIISNLLIMGQKYHVYRHGLILVEVDIHILYKRCKWIYF